MLILIRHDEKSLEVLYPDPETEGVLFGTTEDGIEISYPDSETGHEVTVSIPQGLFEAMTKYWAVRDDEQKSAARCTYMEPYDPAMLQSLSGDTPF